MALAGFNEIATRLTHTGDCISSLSWNDPPSRRGVSLDYNDEYSK